MPTNYRIVDRHQYLEVAFDGPFGFADIEAAIREIVAHPLYPERNDIWIFSVQSNSLTFVDLGTLARLLEKIYPVDAVREKTAIVTSDAFNAAIANLWAQTAADLPYEIRTFADLQEAEKWVCA